MSRPSVGGFSVMEVGVMPKEVIYSRDLLAGGDVRGVVVEHTAVGWSKDKTVQIGMCAGAYVEVTINGQKADPGLWMDLDRSQINQLIRSLRKARDAAYGADA